MDAECQDTEPNNGIRNARLKPADGNYSETPNYQGGPAEVEEDHKVIKVSKLHTYAMRMTMTMIRPLICTGIVLHKSYT